MRFDFIPTRCAGANPSASRANRSNRRCNLELESLEGRLALSSVLAPSATHAPPIVLATPASTKVQPLATTKPPTHPKPVVHPRPNPRPTPTTQSTNGLVTKVPVFNEGYTGPRRADLNVQAASVRFVPGRGLIFTAMMQGAINTHPTTVDQQSYYVFGVDRGSPNAVTPFTNRPNIGFDSTVTVSVLNGGISASVRDLVRSDNTTEQFLPAKDIRVVGHKLQVVVNPALLPTPDQGVPLSQYLFAMAPLSNLDNSGQPDNGPFVASFIPEKDEAPIGVPKGFTG